MVDGALDVLAELKAGSFGDVAGVGVHVRDGFKGRVSACLWVFGSHLMWSSRFIFWEIEGPDVEKFPCDEDG